ncbi:cytochrome P450 4V2, partial [Nephila pilipes]
MIGTGLITSFRKKWKSRRKLLNPCFNYAILKNFVPVMNEQTQVLVKRFKEETSKDFTDIFSLISACTLDVIC